MLRVAFVYPNPRRALIDQIEAGLAPDTSLLGQNHLAELGIEASVHEPALRRRERRSGLLHRLTWNLRELALPWELRDADVACTPLANLFPLTARLRRALRVVVLNISICTTYERSSHARRQLLARSLRAATAVVCFAEAQRERLIGQTGVDPGRVHTVLLGVDERFYTPVALPEDGYVLAVGRDLARDYATFAQAVEGLPTRAVIVASPRNVAGVDLPQGIEVRFDVSYTELRDLYAGASCVVIPTRAEEFHFGADCSGQTVLLDAMAMGRPVVVTERATLREYVRPQETALVVGPEDVTALREAIQRVLADRGLAASLGATGRKLVEESHTTRRLAERVAAVIEAVEADGRES